MKVAVIAGILILIVAGFFFFNREGGATGATITGSSIGVSEKGGAVQTQAAAPVEETKPAAVAPSGLREIAIDANRYTFAPAVIKIKEGERVKITVRNVDATHGISIPAFNARGTESVEFVAPTKGNYPFYCATYCGAGHRDMQGTLIVE